MNPGSIAVNVVIGILIGAAVPEQRAAWRSSLQQRERELAQLFPDGLPTLKKAEHILISEALRRADGNQGMAAGMLGLTRQALNKRLIRNRQSGVDKR